ncbi:MAG: reverse transcriptase-like protein [Prevotellaceae bacterium]|jgi:ribonuclease HI|nr:reverse transcriptase-like protein [Prevotellaceae bacterium]
MEIPIQDSICVDASTSGNPGPTEYRGVDFRTGKVLFNYKLGVATNNIGEFLAIVHALALCKQQNLSVSVIYSDSVSAIAWVRNKKAKTQFDRNEKTEKVYDLIFRAEQWLKTNTTDISILKWDTENWGEIPADYGRK